VPEHVRLGISPCPNDTFIFCGLLSGAVETSPYELETSLLDVQSLNEAALRGEMDVVKVSVAVYARIREDYALLRSGGAMGRGCGPLLVAREGESDPVRTDARIAIPGRLTTAYLLLRLHGGFPGKAAPMGYEQVLTAVASGEADAGLVIHEGRFTYPRYGLRKVLDLGAWWEERTGLPIPLGAIAARRAAGPELAESMEGMIGQSLRYARENPGRVWPFVREHAREMDDVTIASHIDTFVTEYSLDMGATGLEAVRRLIRAGESA
jgi:1,4-dihydroxy-6-naphthoate synthase